MQSKGSKRVRKEDTKKKKEVKEEGCRRRKAKERRIKRV